MANTDAAEVTTLATLGAELNPGGGPGKLRTQQSTFTYATQATADTLTCVDTPAGARVIGFALLTSVTLATATIAIGISGTPAKYRAAATFTIVGTLTIFMLTSGFGTALAAVETPIITTAVATLPVSGTLVVLTLFTID